MNSYDEIQCEELNEIDAYDQMMWVEAMESREDYDGVDAYWDDIFNNISEEYLDNQPMPW
jgi:hypothetical protein